MKKYYVLFNGKFYFVTSDILNIENFKHHTKKSDIHFVSKEPAECIERCECLNSKIFKTIKTQQHEKGKKYL